MGDLLRATRHEVREWAARTIEWRRDFHAHPELSWQETRTQSVILDHLRALPVSDVRPIGKTGATCLVEGSGKGPAIAWRADIDALPIPERSGLPYASKNPGVMHACGHDAHTAIALGLAGIASCRKDLHGSIRFIFQPAEEDNGGADACIADGILEHPHIERVLGLHVSADLPIGSINVAPGPFFAAPTYFSVDIKGVGGHAAAPHQSVDAIVVAAHLVTALQSVVSRSTAPSETAVLTVGTIESGFRWNVIAESARLTGTIRTYAERLRDQMLDRLQSIVAGVSAAFGATATVEHSTSCPPLVNDAGVTAMVEEEARAMFGAGNLFAAPSMGADDMAVFLEQRPGCYFWLGARNEPAGIAGRHHDPGFAIDERVMPLGLELGTRLLDRALKA